jgi:hypothetical protein
MPNGPGAIVAVVAQITVSGLKRPVVTFKCLPIPLLKSGKSFTRMTNLSFKILYSNIMRRSKTVKKRNNRKDLLLVAIEKEPVRAAIQLPLFGNPFENLDNNKLTNNLDQDPHALNKVNILSESGDDPDSLLPDYVKHRAKLGYKLSKEQLEEIEEQEAFDRELYG